MTIKEIEILNKLKANIRRLKINHVFSSKKIDIYNIGYDMRDIISEFSNYGCILTGSSVFCLYGIYSDLPNDIDFLVDEKTWNLLSDKFYLNKYEIYNDDKEIYYFYYKKYKIDIILTYDPIVYDIYSNIKIHNIYSALKAKIIFYKFKYHELVNINYYIENNVDSSESLKNQLKQINQLYKPLYVKIFQFFNNIFFIRNS